MFFLCEFFKSCSGGIYGSYGYGGGDEGRCDDGYRGHGYGFAQVIEMDIALEKVFSQCKYRISETNWEFFIDVIYI